MLFKISHTALIFFLLLALYANAADAHSASDHDDSILTTREVTSTRLNKRWQPKIPNSPAYKFQSFGNQLQDLGCHWGKNMNSITANQWSCWIWDKGNQNNDHEARCSFRLGGYPRKVKGGGLNAEDTQWRNEGSCKDWRNGKIYGW